MSIRRVSAVGGNLADHDHVGIGAQDAAQRARKRQTGARMNLDLEDARKPVLDRVLDRDHVDARTIDVVERRVQRRRLPRAGRTRDQERPERCVVEALDVHLHLKRETDVVEGGRRASLLQQPHDYTLAVDGRQDGDADVELAPALRIQRDAPVLRTAMLGDVQLGVLSTLHTNDELERALP